MNNHHFQDKTGAVRAEICRFARQFVPLPVCMISLLLATFAADAAIFDNTTSGSYSVNTAILPDGGAIPIYNQQTISLAPNDYTLTDVNVMINVSGGYNGDLYGYLIHVDGNGTTKQVNLVNRVGTGDANPIINLYGYSDAGMHIVLDQAATDEIHTYRTVTGYAASIANGSSWNPDGGNLADFNGMGANGTWTLFLADMAGGSTSTLVSWGLALDGTVSVVPEPTTWAAILFGTMFVGAQIIRKRRVAAMRRRIPG